MNTPRRDESGETLAEIIVALVIIGLIVGAFFSAIATTAAATKTHRDFVTADSLLRDSAELTKDAVRNDCTSGPTYSVSFSTALTPPPEGFVPTPGGFTPPSDINSQACPPLSGSADAQTPPVTLTVATPSGTTRSLAIRVRKP